MQLPNQVSDLRVQRHTVRADGEIQHLGWIENRQRGQPETVTTLEQEYRGYGAIYAGCVLGFAKCRGQTANHEDEDGKKADTKCS